MTSIKERTEIAKENKRDIPAILEEIQTLATISNETALSCFYVVFNKEDNKPFVGISVRFAELIASCWGNIHTGAKITKNNGMSVVVQGFVHDFEKNAVFTVEVQRGLGGLSAEKSIQVTNAASSIAFRNAIFKAIPAAITNTVAQNIKKFITEDIDGNSIQKDVSKYFERKGIEDSDLERLFGESFTSDMYSEQLFLLIGLRNAIEEGDTTISEVFGKGEVIKPQRSSKFHFESEEIVDTPIQEEVTKSVDKIQIEEDAVIATKVQENKDQEPSKKGESLEVDVRATKKSLKSSLSKLAETKPKVVEEPIKEEPKKKRGRGRPRKDEK